MLYLYLPVARERAMAIRNAIAEEHKVWLFTRASHAALPDASYVELYVGDNLLDAPDAAVESALEIFAKALA